MHFSYNYYSPLTGTTGNDNVVFMQVDLSDLDSVEQFCKEYNRTENRLDLLINNAGKSTENNVRTIG